MPAAVNPASSTFTQSRRGLSVVRRIHIARTIVLGLGFIGVGTVFRQLGTPWPVWCALLLHGFIWPHLAHALALRAPKPFKMEMRTLLFDGLMVGLWVPLMHFNTLPSAVIIAMTAMSHIGIGGARLLVRGTLAQLLGIAIGTLLYGFHFEPVSTQLNVLSCLPIIMLYPVAIGALTYHLALRLTQQRNALDQLSKRDGLSGLFNRMHWETLVQTEFARCRRHGSMAAIVMLDIDLFKAVNDLGGHAAGDEVIRRLAAQLRANLREIDSAARYGGEEFALLLPDTSLVRAMEVAERLRNLLHQQPLSAMATVTASFGVAELHGEFADHTIWLQCADAALYRAKRQGRDQVAAYMPRAWQQHSAHA